jgi:hypothetical protein
MSDILLDRETHDLPAVIYDLPVVRGVDLIRQRLKQRLLTILGEWFLDGDIGLPWFGELAQKGVSEEQVSALLLRVIAETEGVSEVVAFELALNRRLRNLVVNFRVLSPEGEIPVEIML